MRNVKCWDKGCTEWGQVMGKGVGEGDIKMRPEG